MAILARFCFSARVCIWVDLTFTIANSAATKKALASTNAATANISKNTLPKYIYRALTLQKFTLNPELLLTFFPVNTLFSL